MMLHEPRVGFLIKQHAVLIGGTQPVPGVANDGDLDRARRQRSDWREGPRTAVERPKLNVLSVDHHVAVREAVVDLEETRAHRRARILRHGKVEEVEGLRKAGGHATRRSAWRTSREM